MKYEQIRRVIADMQLPEYRYKQIIDSVFIKNTAIYQQMLVLPLQLRDALTQKLGESFCSLVSIAESVSKQVSKLLFRLTDGNQVEAINLNYRRNWESFCISSQCGCGFGCKFCATGAMGFRRNLTADEITEQLLYFRLKEHSMDSVSFMGMGEPLANPNIFDALRILVKPNLFGLSQRKITISTIGIIPNIQRLTNEFPQVNLAFSLHSAFERQRSELMPVNDKYPLHDVLKVLDTHIAKNGRKVFLAYTLLGGINDSEKHANALVKLIKARGEKAFLYHVDLIPYNLTTIAYQKFSTSPPKTVAVFSKILQSAKISHTVRTQFGSDINAACGQLGVSNMPVLKKTNKAHINDVKN